MSTITLVDANGQEVSLAQAASLVRRVTIATAAPSVDVPVDFNTGFVNPINRVIAVTVAAAAGAGTKTLKFGSPAEQAIPLVLGEVRNGLSITTGLFFNSDGAGGSITLEIHGRP